ncbi:hypothetical protein [Microscilla marina]|uniref:Lipocalin-like domain-containing protein n=1 Tax=Microscilla marina ATCC 23134 TaxID=313606 RepID=A1ZQU0_MICM2|nr:hypothetical protein [Microscilla marina]EAY27245.1 hypothetical protein M23134_06555 [Microscilla marina ATCC 23134]
MGLNRYLRAFAFIFAITSFTQLQAQSAKKLLTRTWVFSFDEMMKVLSPEQKKVIEAMPADQLKLVKKEMSQSYLVFKSRGIFKGVMNGKKEKMEWKLSEDGKTLITIDEFGIEEKIKIIELTKKRLVIQLPNDGEEAPPLVFVSKR